MIGATPRGWIWWLALVGPLWLVMVLCTHWEPVLRDGWGHVYWHIWHDVSLDSIATFAKDSWLGSNPRLGQTITLLLHTPGPYHAIVTPIVELGMFGLLTTLALGRWPSVRRADDALVAATIVALVALCTPQFGPMLFYRPFTGNYLYGFVLGLVWLVPFRLSVGRPPPRRVHDAALALPMLVLGALAGFCNEHTGPAFGALAGLAIVYGWRSGAGIRIWMLAGVVGFLAGYLALLLAPGQDVRYGGLAQQAGILGRIAERGFASNLRVIGILGVYLLPALAWLALGFAARRRGEPATPSIDRRALAVIALAGLACTVTLLASPKLGPRLYLASVALIAAALAGWVCSQLHARWARTACAILAVGSIGYAAARCLVAYHAAGQVNVERQRVIHAAIGTKRSVVVPRHTTAKGHWFLGDDFADTPTLREAVAADYGLAAIELEPQPP